jgi:hypothetical protein
MSLAQNPDLKLTLDVIQFMWSTVQCTTLATTPIAAMTFPFLVHYCTKAIIKAIDVGLDINKAIEKSRQVQHQIIRQSDPGYHSHDEPYRPLPVSDGTSPPIPPAPPPPDFIMTKIGHPPEETGSGSGDDDDE